jgi:hypothetical protein
MIFMVGSIRFEQDEFPACADVEQRCFTLNPRLSHKMRPAVHTKITEQSRSCCVEMGPESGDARSRQQTGMADYAFG